MPALFWVRYSHSQNKFKILNLFLVSQESLATFVLEQSF